MIILDPSVAKTHIRKSLPLCFLVGSLIMGMNHVVSLLVGIGIGLALSNLQTTGIATVADSNNGTTTIGGAPPANSGTAEEEESEVWKYTQQERPAHLKQWSPTNRLMQARNAVARNGGGTQVVSDFIQDLETLHTLTDTQLWFDCANGGKKNTFWMDKDETPQDIWQELALQIWESHPLVRNTKREYAGYEYWCNILTADSGPLEWHVDKDEVVMEVKKEISSPIMGAIYYGYPHRYEGGYLEVLPQVSPSEEPDPMSYYNQPNANVERLQAQYNRMILLNVSHWHRVTPVTTGARFTFAVNLWKTRPKTKEEDLTLSLKQEYEDSGRLVADGRGMTGDRIETNSDDEGDMGWVEG